MSPQVLCTRTCPESKIHCGRRHTIESKPEACRRKPTGRPRFPGAAVLPGQPRGPRSPHRRSAGGRVRVGRERTRFLPGFLEITGLGKAVFENSFPKPTRFFELPEFTSRRPLLSTAGLAFLERTPARVPIPGHGHVPQHLRSAHIPGVEGSGPWHGNSTPGPRLGPVSLSSRHHRIPTNRDTGPNQMPP